MSSTPAATRRADSSFTGFGKLRETTVSAESRPRASGFGFGGDPARKRHRGLASPPLTGRRRGGMRRTGLLAVATLLSTVLVACYPAPADRLPDLRMAR